MLLHSICLRREDIWVNLERKNTATSHDPDGVGRLFGMLRWTPPGPGKVETVGRGSMKVLKSVAVPVIGLKKVIAAYASCF